LPVSSASASSSRSSWGWGACSPAREPEDRTLDLDRYIARDSWLHRADARPKLVLVVASIVAVGLLPVGGYVALAVAWIALVLVAVSARLGAFRLSRGAVIAAPFLLAAVPLIFTRPGEPLGTFAIGPLTLTVSGEGLRMFTTIALKSWISVQAALLLTFTTPFHDLVEALRLLRLPRVIVIVVSFMYRYLAVLFGESSRMLRARSSRSAVVAGRGGGPVRWRARVAGGMVGALFLRSYERSERVYGAMQARGFDGEFRYLPAQPLGGGSLIAFGLLIAALGAFVLAAHAWLPRA
jgi:cobalt/nickel transport system permease protein